ncbi:MAG: hypothetical protein Q6J68_07280 [Thermostichales cyanobacterium SZTDM-1c_bins_54]
MTLPPVLRISSSLRLGLILLGLATLTSAATSAQPSDLFSDTAVNIQLIDPLDPARERARAEAQAGRSDPFQPLDLSVATPTPLPPPPPALTVTTLDGQELPLIEPATPTPDPARFARSVMVSGVMNVDGDIVALVTADQAVPGVVRRGDRYRTARVLAISLERQEVLLEEGGITVARRVNEPVSVASN